MYEHIFTDLSLIPEESVSRLECAMDTDLNELSAVPSKSGISKHNRYTNAVSYTHLTLPTICSV